MPSVHSCVVLTFGAPGSGKTSACRAVSTPYYEDIKVEVGMRICTPRTCIYELSGVRSKDGKIHNLTFIDVPGLGSEIALPYILKQVKNNLQSLSCLNLVLLFMVVDRFNPIQVKEIKASLRFFKILGIKREMIHLILTKAEGLSDAQREDYIQDAFMHPEMTEIAGLFKTGMRGSKVQYERCHFMCFKHPVMSRPELKAIDTKLFLDSRAALIELVTNAPSGTPMGAALISRLQGNTWWGRTKYRVNCWWMCQ